LVQRFAGLATTSYHAEPWPVPVLLPALPPQPRLHVENNFPSGAARLGPGSASLHLF